MTDGIEKLEVTDWDLENEFNPNRLKHNLTEKQKTCDLRKKRLKYDDSDSMPRIFPVLGDEYFKHVERENMFVGFINIKKETSRLIKELSSLWPIGSHLKRVRWSQQKDIFEILIRPYEEDESCFVHNHSISSILKQSNINTTGLMDSVTILEVPKFPVLTRQQYFEAKEYWPVQFREDKNIERMLEDNFFSLNEKKMITRFMKMCLKTAHFGDDKTACIIVDPLSSDIVAVASDKRNSHPLQHAVMISVDLVARCQGGGGSWMIDSEHVYHKPFLEGGRESKIAVVKKNNLDKNAKQMLVPYLSTGFDAYLSKEPCVMCAMALIHSRIRRVFYFHSSSCGAFTSQCRIHLQKGLNHHYEVFRVELKDLEEN